MLNNKQVYLKTHYNIRFVMAVLFNWIYWSDVTEGEINNLTQCLLYKQMKKTKTSNRLIFETNNSFILWYSTHRKHIEEMKCKTGEHKRLTKAKRKINENFLHKPPVDSVWWLIWSNIGFSVLRTGPILAIKYSQIFFDIIEILKY